MYNAAFSFKLKKGDDHKKLFEKEIEYKVFIRPPLILKFSLRNFGF